MFSCRLSIIDLFSFRACSEADQPFKQLRNFKKFLSSISLEFRPGLFGSGKRSSQFAQKRLDQGSDLICRLCSQHGCRPFRGRLILDKDSRWCQRSCFLGGLLLLRLGLPFFLFCSSCETPRPKRVRRFRFCLTALLHFFGFKGKFQQRIGLSRRRPREESILNQSIKLLRMLLFRHHSAVVKYFQSRPWVCFQKRCRMFQWCN